jgi:predicted amidophosphoribosyltransferase
MKKCPYCAEEIQDEAIICKHCGRDLTREPPHVIEQKRSQLTQYLADLEKSLASWERYLEEQNQLAQQAGRQVTLAYVGLFVGIFLVPVFGI